MRTVDDFEAAIVKTMSSPRTDYAGQVLSAAEIYSRLTTHDEVRAYQQALERMLMSQDEKIRRHGVTVCLGFYAFYDVIPRPKLTTSAWSAAEH